MNLLPVRLNQQAGGLVIDGGEGLRFTVPARHVAAYAPQCRHAGDLRSAAGGHLRGTQGARTQPFALRVTAVEALGAEIILSAPQAAARPGRAGDHRPAEPPCPVCRRAKP